MTGHVPVAHFWWATHMWLRSFRFELISSLVAQLVKNPPAMQETLVWFLGWEDPPGEGIDYLLQHSWASLVAQTVKNPPAMQETWVRSLDWKDPWKKEMATHSSILAWKISWMEEPGRLQSMGSKSRRQLRDFTLYIPDTSSLPITVVSSPSV